MTKESVDARGNPRPASKPAIHPALVFTVILAGIFLLHAPLLSLPYFWDEAGYYVPAARDILLSGSLIPHSTLSNAHPPLVLAWVALWWKCAGYATLVARSAMLVVAAFSLSGLFRLAERVANTEVAVASTLCTALYPVFFAQSSLVQVDLAAAGLTFWGLWAYFEDRRVATAWWFTLAALAKETAILAPLALAAWELLRPVVTLGGKSPLPGRASWFESAGASAAVNLPRTRRILPLIFPSAPLILWYAYHYSRTGYVFGNPEFFRYNVAATLNPLRFLLALIFRMWQAFGYLHLWLLTLGMFLAMLLPPLTDSVASRIDFPSEKSEPQGLKPASSAGCSGTTGSRALPGSDVGANHAVERARIAIPIQLVFLVVVAAYIIVMALIGGAELARYMLPATPLVIILAVSTLRRRLRYWKAAVAVVALAFIAGWFWNPPYGFSPEDNLAYRDYVVLHENAERFLEARYPMARVLTAWPASDELTRPWLGYTTRPVRVVRVEDFSLEQVLSAADFRQNFEVALVFSTKYEPRHPWLDRWKTWVQLKRRFFGFHRDLPPAAAAQILGGHVVFSEKRQGQWVAVIEMEQPQILNASVSP